MEGKHAKASGSPKAAGAKTIATGIQDFEDVILGGYFYVDKTRFIKDFPKKRSISMVLLLRERMF